MCVVQVSEGKYEGAGIIRFRATRPPHGPGLNQIISVLSWIRVSLRCVGTSTALLKHVTKVTRRQAPTLSTSMRFAQCK